MKKTKELKQLSSSNYPPFLKLGNYKSEDIANPDKLEVEVTDVDTFETEYGININAIVDKQEAAIPLHNFNSKNTSLLKLWTDNVRKEKIKKGVKFNLYTYLGKSRNDRPIRKWRMEFNS